MKKEKTELSDDRWNCMIINDDVTGRNDDDLEVVQWKMKIAVTSVLSFNFSIVGKHQETEDRRSQLIDSQLVTTFS